MEFKYRGKVVESDNVWVYSDSILQYEYKNKEIQLWQENNGWKNIKPETIGQYIRN